MLHFTSIHLYISLFPLSWISWNHCLQNLFLHLHFIFITQTSTFRVLLTFHLYVTNSIYCAHTNVKNLSSYLAYSSAAAAAAVQEIAEYPYFSIQFSSVQLLSRVRLFPTPWTIARQPSQSITNSRSLLKLMSIKAVIPSHNLILCRPLLLPSIFPST